MGAKWFTRLGCRNQVGMNGEDTGDGNRCLQLV